MLYVKVHILLCRRLLVFQAEAARASAHARKVDKYETEEPREYLYDVEEDGARASESVD